MCRSIPSNSKVVCRISASYFHTIARSEDNIFWLLDDSISSLSSSLSRSIWYNVICTQFDTLCQPICRLGKLNYQYLNRFERSNVNDTALLKCGWFCRWIRWQMFDMFAKFLIADYVWADFETESLKSVFQTIQLKTTSAVNPVWLANFPRINRNQRYSSEYILLERHWFIFEAFVAGYLITLIDKWCNNSLLSSELYLVSPIQLTGCQTMNTKETDWCRFLDNWTNDPPKASNRNYTDAIHSKLRLLNLFI